MHYLMRYIPDSVVKYVFQPLGMFLNELPCVVNFVLLWVVQCVPYIE